MPLPLYADISQRKVHFRATHGKARDHDVWKFDEDRPVCEEFMAALERESAVLFACNLAPIQRLVMEMDDSDHPSLANPALQEVIGSLRASVDNYFAENPAANKANKEALDPVQVAMLGRRCGDADAELVKIGAAAVNLNMRRLRTNDFSEAGQQQLVYSPLFKLVHALDTQSYKADNRISVAYTGWVKQDKESDFVSGEFFCNPDAALLFAHGRHVKMMIELKKDASNPFFDMYRCVMMTCMSILFCVECLRSAQRSGRFDPSAACDALRGLAIPFLIGQGAKGYLYVTMLECPESNDLNLDWIPKVWFVSGHVMTSQFQRCQLAAHLVVLICRVHEFVQQYEDELNIAKKPESGGINALGSSINPEKRQADTDGSKQDAKKPRRGVDGRGGMSGKRTGKQNGPDGMTAGCVAAKAFGRRVNHLVQHSTMRRGTLSRGGEFRLFCFKGRTEDLLSGVFCKVFYVDGGSELVGLNVKQEMDMLRSANEHDIPSPRLVEALSALDFDVPDHVHPSSNAKWYIITMENLKNDVVLARDAYLYALCVIGAVIKMHSVGMLHCDLKPGNIIWNRKEKKASLVDLGHAQWEKNAQSYRSTPGFQAPEVAHDQPHSFESDAYSVGKTLLSVCNECTSGADLTKLREVGEKLSSEASSKRLTLEQAQRIILEQAQAQSTPIHVDRGDRAAFLRRRPADPTKFPPAKRHRRIPLISPLSRQDV